MEYKYVNKLVLDKLNLVDQGKSILVPKLIDLFIKTVPASLEQAIELNNKGDFNEVAQIAHTLKSTTGNLGAYRAYEACVLLENKANESGVTPDNLLPIINDLIKLCNLTIQEFYKIIELK